MLVDMYVKVYETMKLVITLVYIEIFCEYVLVI